MAAFLAGAVVVFLMMGGLGEGQACPANVDDCVDYPEHGSGTVVAFTAVDPEGDPVAWSLSGADSGLFDIDKNGRLTFNTPPDYEDPLDSGRDRVYEVSVTATDGIPDSDDTTRSVNVTVVNLEEPGTISLTTVQPKAGIALGTTLEDPDEVTRNTLTWQWERSTRASGPWTDVDDEDTNDVVEGRTESYTPVEDDVGTYLRVTATYEDGQCTPCDPKKTTQAVSVNSVEAADYSNEPPVFNDANGVKIADNTRIARSVTENSPAGTAVGLSVAATDRAEFGPDVLTYSLGTTDEDDLFDIDAGTGQIRVGTGTALDYDVSATADRQYTVTVTARDSSGEFDTIGVTINVTNVDEDPTITEGLAEIEYDEITGTDPLGQVGGDANIYLATDPEDNREGLDTATHENLRWSLSGRDADKFYIGNRPDNRGRLYFREAPDYEEPTDANRDKVYNVTVEVTDRGRNKSTRDVAVEITNVEEPGLITVSSLNPRIGVTIRATVTDPDKPITGEEWTWTLGLTVVKSDSYAPPAGSSGSPTLTLTYNDGFAKGITTLNAPRLGAIDSRTRNSPKPNFDTSTVERFVPENSGGGTAVGGPVTAGDTDDSNTLTYSLSEPDAAFFSIAQTTGQITVRDKTRLDHEKKSSYRVTVAAEDPNGGRDTVRLTIRVDDVDEEPVITSGYGTIYYAENGTGTVGTYVASDPDDDSITWTLDGVDAGLFTIDGGLLKFMAPPDYEAPGDTGSDNAYDVTVQASDGTDDLVTMEVDVIVTEVDEPGTINGLPERPKESVPINAEIRDPDGTTTDPAWQWAKGSSRTGSFTDIVVEDADGNPTEHTATYRPTEDDVGKYLRVTATYTDPEGPGKSAHVVSTQAVERADYSNMPPRFLDEEEKDLTSTTRSVKENSSPGTKVGAPVAATDIGKNGRQERLTYRLSGADAPSFTINDTTGQIRVKSGTVLDTETKASYSVTVTATDPSDQGDTAAQGDQSRDTISITINVENVDETPIVTVLRTEGVTGTLEGGYKHDEPAGNNPTKLRIEFAGNDPETETDVNTATIKWTLTGTDADDFSIGNYDNTAGVLTFKEDPDFEAPTDSNRNKVYELTVQATDEGDNTVSQAVKVTVENVDEEGSVTLSHVQPEVGTKLTAALTDPDKPSGIRWQWFRGTPGVNDIVTCDATTPQDCRIGNATSASYTPVDGDDAEILTVRASYKDGEGTEKSAKTSSEQRVQLEDEGNERPQFQKAGTLVTTDERSVAEGEELNRNVDLPVVATDQDIEGPNNDALVYTLSGTDAASFSIDNSGQITNDVPLDFETKKTYKVAVKAVDPSGAHATITITIKVTDVDEPPVVSTKGLVAVGSGFISYEENGRGAVAEYTATGSDGASVSWRLGGPDAGDFSINRNGQLTFKRSPNFEVPADANRDNTYEITITARAGRDSDELDVTVNVTNLDEEGDVSLSPARIIVGGQITATLSDIDGTPTGVSWDWAKSEDGATGWTNIAGANSNVYTPVTADVSHYLRATANYTDPEGPGKSVNARTSSTVLADDDGSVTLSETRPEVGDTITATLTDPDGSITNEEWRWASSSDGASGWTDIAGARSKTYTVTSEDTRKFLRATASYDDGDGADKTAAAATSVGVGVDDDGSVSLSPSSPTVGETVTATLTDPDRGITGAIWQWAASSDGTSNWTDIDGATSATYTVVTADLGDYLRASVIYDDTAGAGKSAEAITAAAITADDDGVVTLSPSSPTVGETVTATLTDPDGGVTRATWQWASSSNGTSNWTNIAGANSATYTAAAGVLGSYLRATVIYDDAAGAGKSAEEVTAAAITVDDDGSVTLSPTGPSDGDRVTARLTDPDGGVTGVTWTWAISPNGTSNWVIILSATSATYTPVTTDVGRYLRATASYTDAVGPGKSAEAVTAAAITADDDGSVTLSPTGPSDGDRVTATLTDPDGGVTGVTWTWASSPNGLSGWRDILNATSATYTPVTTDVGRYLRATASYTDAVGPGKSANAVTAAVSEDDDGMVTLSTRTPEVGSAITATLSDPDGGVTGATWQWEKSSNGSTGWTDIQGATSASYTPGQSDAGIYLRATASYDDAVGTGKSAQAATSSGVAQMELLSEYDANRNESIERSEAIRAVSDYFDGEISKDDVLAVLVLYFSG